MTESDWASCVDPYQMLVFLKGKAGDRKLRLFTVACCRRNHGVFHHPAFDLALETGERIADGQAEEREWRVADDALNEIDGNLQIIQKNSIMAVEDVLEPQYPHLPDNIWQAAVNCHQSSLYAAGLKYALNIDPAEQTAQCQLIRDIFGNPFKPVTLNRSWLTSTVVSLAQAIYDERAFDRLPVLADALEESGCTSQEMLEHCRGDGEHVRGCWLVDLLLQKE